MSSDVILRDALATVGERRRIMREERAAIAEELRRIVPQAVAAGIPAAEISSLTGMTRSGVYDIVKRAG